MSLEAKNMKIIHEKEKCISCGACVAVCPNYFEMDQTGKSHLKGSGSNSKGHEELEVQEEISCLQDAADSCPVSIIHIEK